MIPSLLWLLIGIIVMSIPYALAGVIAWVVKTEDEDP